MLEVGHVRGTARGRNAGKRYNGFAWAVATDTAHPPDLYAQTRATLDRLDAVLAELGTDRTRLLSATVYVTDIGAKDEMDRAWCEWIGDDPAHWPQRACVEAGLHGAALVEIVVLAACP